VWISVRKGKSCPSSSFFAHNPFNPLETSKMRLLNSREWLVREFIVDNEIPPYAILSHTWGVEEVIYQSWQTLSRGQVESMTGWKKIRHCREQAAAEGYDWIWVDT